MKYRKFPVFQKLSATIVKLLLLAAEFFLFGLSIMRTSVVSDYEERTDYLIESPFPHLFMLLLFACILFILVLLRIRFDVCGHPFPITNFVKSILKWCRRILLPANLLLALYWVYHTQFQPLGDSSVLWSIACRMAEGNFIDFQYLGYAERHFNQTGALFFLCNLAKLVGYENQFMLQVLNVAALAVLLLCLHGLMKRLFPETIADIASLLLLLYFPISLYVVFTYCNLLSWALIALAMYQEVLLLQEGRKRHGFIMVFAIFCAIMLKSFSWIALIAMVIYGIYESFSKKQFKSLYFLGAAVLLIFSANQLMNHYISEKTGEESRRTMPALGYVAMGMQESYMAPGWYNGIHDMTYLDYSGEKEAMQKAFQSMISKSIQQFKDNPGYFAWFYYHKMASQWNNPSFQGFWFGEISVPDVEVPDWIQSVYTGQLRPKLDCYLNYMLTLIHFGILLWLILDFKKIQIGQLLCGIYFIGGFIFLIFWEAKCQYTIGFFLFMLPFAAAGYHALYRRLCKTAGALMR